MNKELLEAMEVLEKEKNISKETLLEAIENSLLTACKNHFGKADNVRVNINPDTCDFAVYMEKEVVETPEDDQLQISLVDAKMMNPKYPDLVKRLFESEVAEVRDGTVEIKAIAREAGSRSKIAVMSNDPNVDPVGACVGLNGSRVNSIVNELRGEKIDIINWDENPAYLIENALSPAKVICVVADEEEREAQVIVPDYQLSLAIGKEGQNARLAARLTGFKIDIKSETQAREMGLFEQMGLQYGDAPEDTYEEEIQDDYQDYDSEAGQEDADQQ